MPGPPRDAMQTWTGDDAEGMPKPPGDADRYEVRREIGRGGMGTVFLAWDTLLRREVALKVTKARGGADSFLREARIAGRLDHPAIVPVHDAGVSGGQAWYAMRLVPGRSLADAIAAANTPRERLGLLDAVIDLARAVAHAHALGVVHRDIKPENVMLGPLGEVQVVDWGLARVLEEADPDLRALVADPEAGRVAGTPAYMSPEQARGNPADARSDVWALGMILRELCGAARPWAPQSGPDEVVAIVREGQLPDLPDEVPAELAAVARRCTAADPAGRYPEAGAVAADLLAFRSGARVAAHTYNWRDELGRFERRFWWPIRAAAALAVVGVLAAAGVVWAWRDAVEQERRAEVANAGLADANGALGESLRGTLLERAMAADRARDPVTAAAFAVAALARGEDPVARGIAARWVDDLPVQVERILGEVPGPCSDLVFDEGVGLVCAGPAGVWVWKDGLRWHRADAWERVLVVHDGKVLVSDHARTVALSAADGASLWEAPAADRGAWSGDTVLLVQGRDGYLLSEDGALRKQITVGGQVSGLDPAPDGFVGWNADGRSFGVSRDGVRTNRTRWQIPGSAAAVAQSGSHVVWVGVNRGAGVMRLTDQVSTTLAVPLGFNSAGVFHELGWVGRDDAAALVDPVAGTVGPLFPLARSRIALAHDRLYHVVSGHLVELGVNPWQGLVVPSGVAGIFPLAGDRVVLRGGAEGLLVDQRTGAVSSRVTPPAGHRGLGPIVHLESGRWIVAQDGLWQIDEGGERLVLAGHVKDLQAWRGGYVALLPDRVWALDGAGNQWETSLLVSSNAILARLGNDRVGVLQDDHSIDIVDGGPPIHLDARSSDVVLGPPAWWQVDGVVERADDPAQSFPGHFPESRQIVAWRDGYVVRNPWDIVVVDGSGVVLATAGPWDTRTGGMAVVGDHLWVGRLSGEVERLWLPALAMDAAALGAEVRRRSGWTVEAGRMVPSLP